MRHKLPAAVNIGIEIDRDVIDRWEAPEGVKCQIIRGDAPEILRALDLGEGDLVYMDPPYFPSTRLRARVYRHDYSQRDHEILLQEATRLQCMVMISGYRCELYDQSLEKWNRHDYEAWTHTGMRTESVWFNFPLPTRLHDPRFIGENFRKRQDARRRMERLREKIGALSRAEQACLLDWLASSIETRERGYVPMLEELK